jgi:hypothetical protein
MYATLVQLTSTISMNVTNGALSFTLGSNSVINAAPVLSTDQWHHFGFVYDATQQTAIIYIDGNAEVTGTPVKSEIVSNPNNSLVIVGAGYQGYIDQLSLLLKAKSAMEILWDATTAGYYPLDVLYSLDKGPNGINATASNVIPIYGWPNNALNFNISGSTYQTGGFTELGTPRASFSITLWVRAETQPGIFLTVANPYTCLLVFGLQDNTNNLVVYLPNATPSGDGVNIIGPLMPTFHWVNVAFTWSLQNRAQLYTSGYLQGSGFEASALNNARGGNNSLPMIVTFGSYSGQANCQGIAGINSSQEFMGSIDEVYVFGRELTQSDIEQILTPPSD